MNQDVVSVSDRKLTKSGEDYAILRSFIYTASDTNHPETAVGILEQLIKNTPQVPDNKAKDIEENLRRRTISQQSKSPLIFNCLNALLDERYLFTDDDKEFILIYLANCITLYNMPPQLAGLVLVFFEANIEKLPEEVFSVLLEMTELVIISGKYENDVKYYAFALRERLLAIDNLKNDYRTEMATNIHNDRPHLDIHFKKITEG